ncbi:acyl-CoA synthetase [Roseomonas sp. JC162]|uniref:3-methylmercaptopropionyl-CoA ligase n=1 Tax=Neoroseomonas marina TaxID=1232220 RepID=A0A848EJ56_9PROT|nr:acyl-CoA synthetase [Neoroseomonas marina]NMJ44421.1 acyl-CoA synthetase [Neoroseomonas marina]
MADYETGLAQNAANHQPLTPLLFMERAAQVYPDQPAVVHGAVRRTYRELRDRCVRLASALAKRGIGKGDTVAAVLPNIPEMLECHYGVPMAGAVLNTINTRLDAATIAYILDHGEAKALIVDKEFMPAVRLALVQAKAKPLVIEVDDALVPAAAKTETLGGMGYEALLSEGDPAFAWPMPRDEWDAITLNYTSGTTGKPKGVVYHHRGAYLLAVGNVLSAEMGKHPVYLWTLPMFHCNGWCFPWTVTAQAGLHVCLRAVRGPDMWRLMAGEGVTNMCGAPIVMSTLLNTPEGEKRALPHQVKFIVAGAPPPEAVLAAMKAAGFAVCHVYGLTEVYGPSVVNEWHQDWNAKPASEQAALMARQGVRYLALEGLDVMDPETMAPVPADGATLGEVMMQGNVVMKGYLKDAAATGSAFKGGWFHTGDLAVKYPDGYIQLKDRSKDIIISGGENISSIEVEDALYKHPAVAVVAVVARPDEKWGETPCAFVELKPGASATAEELIAFSKQHLAGYKVPRHVVFAELPKTSTGKIQKHVLRSQAKE